MSILALLGVLDEVELLPHAIEHLRHIGVDRIIALDAGSTDGSLEVLAEAERSGDLWTLRVAQDGADDRTERIKSELARDSGAEWVIALDVDEFLLPASGTLRGLSELDEADTLSVFRYNVALGSSGAEIRWPLAPEMYPELLLYALPEPTFHGLGFSPEHPSIQWLQESKVMVRPAVFGQLGSGDHEIAANHERAWRQLTSTQLLIAHVPFSTPERFRRKSRNVRRSVDRDPERFEGGHLWHWVRWAQADAEGRSDAEFDAQVATPEVLADLKDRSIVRSAAGMLDQPIMHLQGAAGREAVVRAQPWLTMAGRVCAAEGIPVQRKLEPAFASTYPTVLAPPGHVIKFFSRQQPSLAVHAAEARALRRVARDPGLPVPRLVASGRLDDWRYLVMTRVPGQVLTFLLDTLDGSVVRDVAAWTGEFARRLHAIELTVSEVDAAHAEFATSIDQRHAEAPARLADRGALPDRLLDQVSAWLPSPQEMLDASGHPVLVHGGLQDDHIMVTSRDDPRGLRAVAVIDFGDALVGHPYFDLGPAWWTWLNADRRYLDAFLEAARLPGWDGPGFARMALAWTLIRCSWNPKAPPFLNEAHDLDELAELSFGSRR